MDPLLELIGAQDSPGQPTGQPPAQMPMWQRAAKGVSDVLTGPAQMLYNSMPSPVRNAGDALDQWLFQKTGGVAGLPPDTNLNQGIAAQEASYQKSRGTGVDWARLGGSAIGSAPLAAMLPAQSGITGGALLGGLYGGLQPVTSGDYTTSKLGQMGTGAVLGGGISAIGSGIAKAISPRLSPQVQTLIDSGVTPTPGQILGGPAKRIEEGSTSIPVLGDMVKNAQRRSVIDLNTAAINRSLTPIGDELPNGMTGYKAIDYAANKIGDAYDSLISKIGSVHPDPKFSADLTSLEGLTQNLAKDKGEQFSRIVQNEITDRITNGTMTAEGLKAAESNLGQISRSYMRASDYDTRMLGTALQEAQATIRSMLQRTQPEYASELQSVNTAYANLLRPQRAAAFSGSQDGIFSPEALQTAVRALDPSKNKSSFGRGNALMQDLSTAGRGVLGDKLPDSGTPFRHFVALGLGGLLGHSVLPPIAGEAMVGSGLLGGAMALPYTKLGQESLAALLAKRPEIAPLLADQVRQVAPYLGAAGGLLQQR